MFRKACSTLVAVLIGVGVMNGCRPAGLAQILAQRLRAGGRVDLRNVAADRWDRIGLFWYASPKVINRELGFSWDHPDATKVDLFDGRDLVLFVIARGAKVVDHALVPRKDLSSCAGSLMVARENAVFVSKGHWVCPESGPPPGRGFRERPPW